MATTIQRINERRYDSVIQNIDAASEEQIISAARHIFDQGWAIGVGSTDEEILHRAHIIEATRHEQQTEAAQQVARVYDEMIAAQAVRVEPEPVSMTKQEALARGLIASPYSRSAFLSRMQTSTQRTIGTALMRKAVLEVEVEEATELQAYIQGLASEHEKRVQLMYERLQADAYRNAHQR